MKLDKALFALVLLFGLVVLIVALLPETADSGGAPHPEFPTLQAGGSGEGRHGPLLWPGWLFGTSMMLIVVGLMAFGARRRDGLRGLGWPLAASALAHFAMWSLIVLAYGSSLGRPGVDLLFGLPLSTALMIYVFYPVSAAFNLCYVIGFKRWVLSADDLARFDRLLAEKRARALASDD
jgi:hypothetical protein